MNLSEKRAAHIAKSYGVDLEVIALNEVNDLIKAHKMHKYLRIENGKYIYDYDKMSAEDHKKAAREHNELYNSPRRDKEWNDYHYNEKEKHEKLAKQKANDSKIRKRYDDGEDMEYIAEKMNLTVDQVESSINRTGKINQRKREELKQADNKITMFIHGDYNTLRELSNNIDDIANSHSGEFGNGNTKDGFFYHFKNIESAEKFKNKLKSSFSGLKISKVK